MKGANSGLSKFGACRTCMLLSGILLAASIALIVFPDSPPEFVILGEIGAASFGGLATIHLVAYYLRNR